MMFIISMRLLTGSTLDYKYCHCTNNNQSDKIEKVLFDSMYC